MNDLRSGILVARSNDRIYPETAPVRLCLPDPCLILSPFPMSSPMLPSDAFCCSLATVLTSSRARSRLQVILLLARNGLAAGSNIRRGRGSMRCCIFLPKQTCFLLRRDLPHRHGRINGRYRHAEIHRGLRRPLSGSLLSSLIEHHFDQRFSGVGVDFLQTLGRDLPGTN